MFTEKKFVLRNYFTLAAYKNIRRDLSFIRPTLISLYGLNSKRSSGPIKDIYFQHAILCAVRRKKKERTTQLVIQYHLDSISSEVTRYFCLDHDRLIGIQTNLIRGEMHGVTLIIMRIIIGRSRSKQHILLPQVIRICILYGIKPCRMLLGPQNLFQNLF